jgi:uncharacterized RDD family membrane protein YckC
MTDQPSPSRGGVDPPPPPAGGHAPPIRASQAYTPWANRVGAFLIDNLPFAIILGVGWLVLQNSYQSACLIETRPIDAVEVCDTGYSTLGLTVFPVTALLGLVYLLWDYGYRQGRTGSSIGKSVLNFQVVSEKTGAPIGFGMSVLRQLAHLVDGVIFGIGYLLPLWDAKRQTLADKIMSTVCLPLETTGRPNSPTS